MKLPAFFLLASLVALGCTLEQPLDPAEGPDPGEPTPSEPENGTPDTLEIAGVYEVEWTVFAHNTSVVNEDLVEAICPGSITIEADGGADFAGSYLMLALEGCANGNSVSGAVTDGQLREDGGVNFGLRVPGSDDNIFEDFLAGSDIQLEGLRMLGCVVEAKDEDNQMVGSVLDGVISAAASAAVSCPDDEDGDEDGPQDPTTVQVRISLEGQLQE